MKSGVHMTKDKLSVVMRGLGELPRREVLVGIPELRTQRSTLEEAQPLTNAAIGYIHENGAPEMNIPARPFLLPGIRNARAEIAKYMRQAAEALMARGQEGAMDKAERAMHAAGLVAVNAVQSKITEGPFAPLAPATIAARLRRGRTGTRPLIDTGQLRRAITYVIRNRKRDGTA